MFDRNVIDITVFDSDAEPRNCSYCSAQVEDRNRMKIKTDSNLRKNDRVDNLVHF